MLPGKGGSSENIGAVKEAGGSPEGRAGSSKREEAPGE